MGAAVCLCPLNDKVLKKMWHNYKGQIEHVLYFSCDWKYIFTPSADGLSVSSSSTLNHASSCWYYKLKGVAKKLSITIVWEISPFLRLFSHTFFLIFFYVYYILLIQILCTRKMDKSPASTSL